MNTKITAAALAVGLLAATGADAATLKFATFEPAQGMPARNNYAPWFEAVERDSQGTLTFQKFWGGALSRAPNKQFELMMNGMQDMAMTLPSYTQALFPEFSIFEQPFTFRSAVEGGTVEWKMYEQGHLSGMNQVKVIAIYNNGNSALHVNRKIENLDDVKGLKIRTAGPAEAELIKTLGGAPVAIAIGQVPESLHRGVINGTLNGWSANQTFKITPLIKSHYDAPFGVRTFFLSIRKDAYDALPEQARKAIDKHSGLETSRAWSTSFDRENAKTREEALKDAERNVIVPTEAQIEELRKLFRPQREEWIKTHPDGQKVHDALEKILAEVRTRG